MEKEPIIYPDIPKEKFESVGGIAYRAEEISGEKSVGYLGDAWRRFRKNKASIAAAIIIICIVLFALFAPIFISSHDATFIDPYYAKCGPRISVLRNSIGIFTGGASRSVSERGLMQLAAIGIGAEDSLGTGASDSAILSEYSPIIKYSEGRMGAVGKRTFKAKIDKYLEVGFIYINVSAAEYERIAEWQSSTGIPVLYPLVKSNGYNPDSSNANNWYMADSRGTPLEVTYKTEADGSFTLDDNGESIVESTRTLTFSEDMRLADNYVRDSEGAPVYYRYSGGGNNESAERRVRVLYYNYYRYKNGVEPNYIFGTDSQGYDLALRMASGIRLSLLIAVAVSFINLIIGTLYGAVEGYYGGAVDLAMERAADILSGVPAIVVQTLFQIHLAARVGVIPSLLFAFVLTGWLGTAARVRTQFYRFKNMEYVMAARTLGAKDGRIIWKHIFPNTLGTVITASVLIIPGVIFTESMLSFLGIVNLGGQRITSLGTLLSDASGIWTNYPHLMLLPAAVISLLMICFNLFGNGLRDALNPSLRGVED